MFGFQLCLFYFWLRYRFVFSVCFEAVFRMGLEMEVVCDGFEVSLRGLFTGFVDVLTFYCLCWALS